MALGITFSAGNKVTGAQLMAIVTQVDALTSGRPQAFLRQTSNQSIAHGSWTALNFDTEDVDTHNGHSTSSNTSRYTAQVAGWYRVIGRGGFAANSTGHRGVRIHKNGSVINGSGDYFQTTTGDVWSNVGSADVHLNVGDYVETAVIQDSGGALNTSASAGDVAPSMSVTLINED